METDEVCECGHKRSEHTDGVAAGHGACKICVCRKFTWTSYISTGDKKCPMCKSPLVEEQGRDDERSWIRGRWCPNPKCNFAEGDV